MKIAHTTTPVGTPVGSPVGAQKLYDTKKNKESQKKEFLIDTLKRMDLYSDKEIKMAYKDFKFLLDKIANMRSLEPTSIFFMTTGQIVDEINRSPFLKPHSKMCLRHVAMDENLNIDLERGVTPPMGPRPSTPDTVLQFDLEL